jgi:hypothetical protein
MERILKERIKGNREVRATSPEIECPIVTCAQVGDWCYQNSTLVNRYVARIEGWERWWRRGGEEDWKKGVVGERREGEGRGKGGHGEEERQGIERQARERQGRKVRGGRVRLS